MSNSTKDSNLEANLEQNSQVELENQISGQIIYPINFCQTKEWANFWLKASGVPHQILTFENIQIYIYPWQFGQFFGYIPKMRLKNTQQWKALLDFIANLKQNLEKIENAKIESGKTGNLEKAGKKPKSLGEIKNLVFVKIDFDLVSLSIICPELSQEREIWQSKNPDLYNFPIDKKLKETNQRIAQNLQKLIQKSSNINPQKNKIQKVTSASKKIQYLQSTTIILPKIEIIKKSQNPEQKLSNLNSNLNPKQKIQSQSLQNSHLDKIVSNPQNNLQNNLNNPDFQVLNDFYQNSQELWVDFSPRIRRYTRKILKELEQNKFTITLEKTQESWQDFYDLHLQTAQRQNFPTQIKEYLHELFWQPFVRTIIIKNESGQTESVFLGILQDNSESIQSNWQSWERLEKWEKERENLNQNNSGQKLPDELSEILLDELAQNPNSNPNANLKIENSQKSQKILTYLLGGNSQDGLTGNVQYLLQLTALWLCYQENCRFYDMGGWEFGTGYSQFKNHYKGNLQTFFGPFDFVLKPINYNLTNFAINFAKKIRNPKAILNFKK